MKVKVIHEVGFNENEKEKLMKALNLIDKTINSEAFKKQILEFEYKGKKEFNYNYLVDSPNKKLSNQDVYNHFMSGAERKKYAADSEMDLDIGIDHGIPDDPKDVGYTLYKTDLKRSIIRTYRSRLDGFSYVWYAGHIVHEYCHSIGFSHKSLGDGPARDATVPYAIGEMARHVFHSIILKQNIGSLEEIAALA